MKAIICLFGCLLWLACQPQPKSPEPPTIASLWASNTISTEAPEFATTLNKDQTEVFFNRTTPDRSSMCIMRAVFKDGQWSAADSLPFSTGQYLDVDPFLSADGKRLYFSSDRPKSPGAEPGDLDTWYVERTDTGWSAPVNPGPELNSDSTEIFNTLADNGNAYVVSERDGDRGIKVIRFVDGQYRTAEKVVLKLRGEPIYASNPCIASDESFIIVASRDPEGNGTPDLFVSFRQKDGWGPMLNLGPAVNSDYADFAPGLSKDNNTLFFTSERPGIVPAQAEGVRPPGDIYWVDLKKVLSELIPATK